MRQLNVKNLLIAITFGLVFLKPALAGTTFGVSDCGRWVTESKSARISGPNAMTRCQVCLSDNITSNNTGLWD